MTTQRRSLLGLLALLLSFVLVAAACGDDTEVGTDGTDGVIVDNGDDDGDDGTTDPGTTDDGSDDGADDDGADDGSTGLTASSKGVTESEIHVGVSLLDFQALVDLGLSAAGWGDQIAYWDIMIEDVNANGGVLGRDIVPVYEMYSAIDPADADRVCSALTEDNDVFAVLGGFVGPLAGTVDPCITGLNNTILVGGDQTDDELEASNAPWYQPGQAANASNVILLNLLEQDGRLDGQTVFVMAGLADEASHDSVIQQLQDRGVEVVGDGIIVAPDGDTAAQDTELGIMTERIKELGATAVYIHGNPSSSIRGLANAGLNTELNIWTNNPSGLNNLGETIIDNSVADGVITVSGPTDTFIWEDPAYQSECSDVVAAALPDADIRPPLDYAEEEENLFNGIRYGCRLIHLFVDIAEAAGEDLTPETFVAGAESLTDFSFPGSPNASLGPDKLFADDMFALAAYDSTAGDGQAVPLDDLVDIFG
ncbi:MAG: ABC transporter substrate-binding protein [Acidimicrobiales bacterium]|nr:ABC transporter substrate-binding protein [Acidimicrobiales bacterium]